MRERRFRALGSAEWVLRLSLIAVGLLSILAFRDVALKVTAPRWAEVSTALFAAMPMFWYFSLIIVHEVYALAFSLTALGFALRWSERRRPVQFIGMLVTLTLACLSDWLGYFAAGSIALVFLLERPSRWKEALATGGAAIAGIALHLSHLFLLDRSGGLIRRFLSLPEERMDLKVSLDSYLFGEAREIALYFGVGTLILAVVGMAGFCRRPREIPGRVLYSVLLLGANEILFVQWAHLHDYLSFGWAPFVALSAGLGIKALWDAGTKPARIVAGGLLAFAAFQSAWIMSDRLTRIGPYEVAWQVGIAMKQATGPREKTLVAFDNRRICSAYYSDRYVSCMDVGIHSITGPYGFKDVPIADPEALARWLERGAPGFDWVVTTDPASAKHHLNYFRRMGERANDLLPRYWIFDQGHAIHRALERRSLEAKRENGFVFYRMR